MYLLSNNYKSLIGNFFVTLILIIAQIYFPKIVTSEQYLLITIDFLLIYLLYLCFYYQIYLVIIFSFFIGLFQDMIVQSLTIGLFSFLNVLFVYFAGFLKDSNKIWTFKFKCVFLFSLIFLHKFLYHFVFINQVNYFAILFILIESMMNLILIVIIDKMILNKLFIR